MYDGVNIIGRSPKATVVFKDIVSSYVRVRVRFKIYSLRQAVSQQQSILIVVNGEHYISDCNSNNGTYLESLKLQPLLLYSVGDNSRVRFASIDATYFKVSNEVRADKWCVSSANKTMHEQLESETSFKVCLVLKLER